MCLYPCIFNLFLICIQYFQTGSWIWTVCVCWTTTRAAISVAIYYPRILEIRTTKKFKHIFAFKGMFHIFWLFFKTSHFRDCKGRRGMSWRRKMESGMYKVLSSWSFSENVWQHSFKIRLKSTQVITKLIHNSNSLIIGSLIAHSVWTSESILLNYTVHCTHQWI